MRIAYSQFGRSGLDPQVQGRELARLLRSNAGGALSRQVLQDVEVDLTGAPVTVLVTRLFRAVIDTVREDTGREADVRLIRWLHSSEQGTLDAVLRRIFSLFGNDGSSGDPNSGDAPTGGSSEGGPAAFAGIGERARGCGAALSRGETGQGIRA